MSRSKWLVLCAAILIGLVCAGYKLLLCLRGRAKRAASAISIAREWVHKVGVAKRRRGGRVFGIAILSLLLLKVPNIFTQSMRLQDAALGSVVQIGSFNYIKVAENKYMQSAQVTCPDSATVGGMYVKCFKDKSAYESACSESGDCSCIYKQTISYFNENIDLYQCTQACPQNASYDSITRKCVCDNALYTFQYIDEYEMYACAPKPIQDFDFTGTVQTFTTPLNGTYKLEVWGAQGGSSSVHSQTGGLGGYSVGTINATAGTIYYIYVGGQGNNTIDNASKGMINEGGWNGGGSVYYDDSGYHSGAIAQHAATGGGATDISTVYSSVTLDSYYRWIRTNASYNGRIIVAGGGGGGEYYAAGHGGGTTGTCGYGSSYGTQSSAGSAPNTTFTKAIGGSLGYGNSIGAGHISHSMAAVGGGGYYGGGFGYSGNMNGGTSYASGCGGSGYIGGVVGGSTYAGSASFPSPTGDTETGHSGNGYARITLISVD